MEKFKEAFKGNWKGALFGALAVAIIMFGMPSDMAFSLLDIVSDSEALKAAVCE